MNGWFGVSSGILSCCSRSVSREQSFTEASGVSTDARRRRPRAPVATICAAHEGSDLVNAVGRLARAHRALEARAGVTPELVGF